VSRTAVCACIPPQVRDVHSAVIVLAADYHTVTHPGNQRNKHSNYNPMADRHFAQGSIKSVFQLQQGFGEGHCSSLTKHIYCRRGMPWNYRWTAAAGTGKCGCTAVLRTDPDLLKTCAALPQPHTKLDHKTPQLSQTFTG
jgi:hypothetical protein